MSSLLHENLAERTRLPLYARVADSVRAEIARKRLEPGAMLPSEAELQRRFNVSRATVRQAVQELVVEGVVERHQGRGTFVAVPRLERALPELTSFSEHVASQGLAAASQLVSWDEVPGGDAHERRLPSQDAPDPRLFRRAQLPLARVVRLRLANESPVGLHTTLVPLAVANSIGFTPEQLRRDERLSLYRELERAGYRIDAADEHLSARLLSRAEAGLLGVARTTAAVSVLRLSRDGRGQLVEAVRAVYLGHKYDYVISLKRSQPERRHR